MHPMKVRIEDLLQGRLKQSSFVHRGKRPARVSSRPTCRQNTFEYPVPWEQTGDTMQISFPEHS